jgi:hypothetical protein
VGHFGVSPGRGDCVDGIKQNLLLHRLKIAADGGVIDNYDFMGSERVFRRVSFLTFQHHE